MPFHCACSARRIDRSRQRGAVYVFLLFAVALSGILLAGAGQVWSTASRREKEAQLLFAGEEYRQAIASYRDASEQKLFPQRIEDLLLDPRFPNVRRHLRQRYREPFSADGGWELIKVQDRIVGVRSLSQLEPIKQDGFRAEQASFAGAKHYADWQFVAAATGG